jgi:hypothetical protein
MRGGIPSPPVVLHGVVLTFTVFQTKSFRVLDSSKGQDPYLISVGT